MTLGQSPMPAVIGRAGLPVAGRGQVVGLLGGSFDPPHGGHAHITRAALKRFGLDQVWWLVSPGNPLKARPPAPLARRLEAGQRLMQHPKVRVTGIEARLGTRYTARTIIALQRLYPHVRFVWLMGADNLVQFHQWQEWEEIMARVPIGVLARPGDRLAARLSRAGRQYRWAKVPRHLAQGLGRMHAPAWCFLNLPMDDISSTELRAAGAWPSQGGARAAE